jgi:hypothetical protein
MNYLSEDNLNLRRRRDNEKNEVVDDCFSDGRGYGLGLDGAQFRPRAR